MNIVTKPLVDFSGLNFTLPKLSNIEGVDLNEELQQIQKMIQAGIIPSGSRVKEFVGLCYQKGELKERMDDVIACLVAICRLEEETLSETSLELKEILVICDSDNILG